MRLFKKVIAVLAIATMSLTMTACSGNKATTQAATSEDEHGLIIARVGGEPIYKYALDSQMAQMEYYMQMVYGQDFKNDAEAMEQYNGYRDEVVESLISAEVLALEAKKMDSLKVTEDEINEQLEATKANFSSEDEFNSALEQSSMSLDLLKSNIEKNIYVQKLVDEYKANQVTVTDEDIEKYYNDNIANYTKKPGANIYHILVDSEEKANEVLDKYNAGTSFSDLAAEYGTDGTKSTGGALGFIEYDTTQYDADFMAGAKTLAEGEVSKPVKTQFGWHIIKVDGIQKEEKVQPLEEVKEGISAALKGSKAEQMLTENIENWLKNYEVVYYKENYQTEVPVATEGTDSTEAANDNAAEASPEASAAN